MLTVTNALRQIINNPCTTLKKLCFNFSLNVTDNLPAVGSHLLWPGAGSKRSNEYKWCFVSVPHQHDFSKCLRSHQRKFPFFSKTQFSS
jgi:hypothetical protein